MRWMSMPRFGQRAAIASRVAAVLLVVVAFEMVISRIDEGAGPGLSGSGATPSDASTLAEVCQRPADGVLVVLTASRVLPQERVLEANVAVCRVTRTRQDLLTEDRRRVTADGTLRSELVSHPVTLVIRGLDQVGEARVETTVGDLFGSERGVIPRLGPVSVPLDGRPDKYPFDWFSFYGYAQLEFAPGVIVPRSIKGENEDPDPAVLPVRLALLTVPAVGDFDFGVRQTDRPYPLTFAGPGLIFGVERRALTRRFVIVILLVPVLYAVLFALLLGQRHHQASSSLRDLLIGMVAATVALLPLRQVLVPGDVPGLTVVDWWLGGTILLFVAISLWAFPVAVGAIEVSDAPAHPPKPPVIVSIAAAVAWTAFLVLAAINVPIALVSDEDHMPPSSAGRIGMLMIAAACLVGAFVSGRALVANHWAKRSALSELTRRQYIVLALAVAAAGLVLFTAAWFLIINLGWALGGGAPYG